MPPVAYTAQGTLRVVGVEIEFAGLDAGTSAGLVQEVFGGEVVTQPHDDRTVETTLGTFKVELDTSIFKRGWHERVLRHLGLEPGGDSMKLAEAWLRQAATVVIPHEIVTPPLPLDQLHRTDQLRDRLRLAQARGTSQSTLYAFGLHLNPQVPRMEPMTVLRHLQAFLLLQPWIRQRVRVNFARWVTPYVDDFPDSYLFVLDPTYVPDTDRLIDDYLAHNATRNRPLDMLPVLGVFDADRVRAGMERVQHHLLKPRPAFHYRLPNCLVDVAEWTIASEWETWLAVERLAADEGRLLAMCRAFADCRARSLKPFWDPWRKDLARWQA